MSDAPVRTPESGYICVWGTTPKEKVVDAEGVVVQCPGCGQQARMIGKRSIPYCAVFYIPLFPEGAGEEYIECTACGGKFQGSVAEIRARIEQHGRETAERITEKRRALEADPDDVEVGSELIELLMSADRVAEGRSLAEKLSARHPEDVNLLVLHSRILLQQGILADAQRRLDRAIGLNPQHAGAHFFRAVVLASGDAPNFAEALEAARQAHRLGHPEGRALIAAFEEELGKQG